MMILPVAAVYDRRIPSLKSLLATVIDRRYSRFFLAATFVLLLTACSKLTETNLDKINNGMTTDEVKAILGEPTDQQTKEMFGISTTAFTYHTSTSNVAITFLNGKVIGKEGDFK